MFQMDIDAIFREIGELGPQQRMYGGCLCLMNGYAAFHMLQVSLHDLLLYLFQFFALCVVCSMLLSVLR